MRTRIPALVLVLGLVLCLCGCAAASGEPSRLTVIAASFPPYDIARAVIGDVPGVKLEMLLSPGEEVHAFEPTPRDMIAIGECELFLHVGGESDVWVESVLSALDRPVNALTLFACVDLLESETVEGMEAEHEHDHAHDHGADHVHDHGHETEYDEHIWLDPLRVVEMSRTIADELSRLDPEYAQAYQDNARAHIAALQALDQDFAALRQEAVRDTVIFADRFPARYFADRYDLSYYAAFPGCSSQTEASAATVAFLVDRVKREAVPAVFYTEFSTRRMADTLQEATGCETVRFHSAHNVSLEDFQAGVTYLDLMRGNLESMRKALCNEFDSMS